MSSPYTCPSCGRTVDPKGFEHECPGSMDERLTRLERKFARIESASREARYAINGDKGRGPDKSIDVAVLTGIIEPVLAAVLSDSDEDDDSGPQSMRE